MGYADKKVHVIPQRKEGTHHAFIASTKQNRSLIVHQTLEWLFKFTQTLQGAIGQKTLFVEVDVGIRASQR